MSKINYGVLGVLIIILCVFVKLSIASVPETVHNDTIKLDLAFLALKNAYYENYIDFTKNYQIAMRSDLDSYNHLSESEKSEIMSSIFKYSDIYDVDPCILYAVLKTESEMHPKIEHNSTYIKSLNKKIKAVGLGGVVWEFWGTKLRDANIAKIRSDLFEIEANIAASAFILNELKHLPKLPKAKNITESMLMRYYGSQTAGYHKKIYYRVAQLFTFE